MKTLIIIVIIGLSSGCATESFINDDGTRNWKGRLLWESRDAVEWEGQEE